MTGTDLKKVFIANRGEVAVRIVRACQRLGITTVVGFSEADRESLPVKMADSAICIGPARSLDSYLNADAVISAAMATGCDALHPGYGFLAESPHLAQLCEEQGLIFVGPTPDVMRVMGDKSAARKIAKEGGVPVLEGTGPLASLEEARIGSFTYPMLVKAVAGGGGRGIRIASNASELIEAFEIGRREAEAAFGDGRLYLERFIPRARHVEVQVIADAHGTVIHLGERECSVQRRHQKVLEEAPAPVSQDVRERVQTYALQLSEAIGYVNAGTVEFVLDADTEDVWFIEMNTRLQVEHAVTEMITGVDIVAQQLRIAAGCPIAFAQEDVSVLGHAIEWRVTAESVSTGFVPQPGRIVQWRTPELPGIRVDSHCYEGYDVPPYYDSLIAKLVAHGHDRSDAIDRLAQAADVFRVEGIPTTLGLCRRVVDDDAFRHAEITTTWLESALSRWEETSLGA